MTDLQQVQLEELTRDWLRFRVFLRLIAAVHVLCKKMDSGFRVIVRLKECATKAAAAGPHKIRLLARQGEDVCPAMRQDPL